MDERTDEQERRARWLVEWNCWLSPEQGRHLLAEIGYSELGVE